MESEQHLKMYLTEYSVARVSKFSKQNEWSNLSLYIYHFASSVVFPSIDNNPYNKIFRRRTSVL